MQNLEKVKFILGNNNIIKFFNYCIKSFSNLA